MKTDFPVQTQLQTQNHKMFQQLMMSPHMQQAIRLMQMPLLELASEIELQVAQNPVIEIADESTPSEVEEESVAEQDPFLEKELHLDEHHFEILQKLDQDFQDYFSENDSFQSSSTSEEEKQKTYFDSLIQNSPSMYESLLLQAKEHFSDEKSLAIAQVIIGNFNEHGYLETPIEEIAALYSFEVKDLESVWKNIKTFDPPGIGASSIQESLLIQLQSQKKGDSLAYLLIKDYYDELLHNKIPYIQKKVGCSFDDIQKAVHHEIARLDVRPGMQFANLQQQGILPDVTLRQEGEQLIIETNGDDLPNIRLNRRYLRMLNEETVPKETKDYIKQHITSAKWLMRTIQQRQSTIERIAGYLAVKQKEYLLNPNGQLQPLTMKSVAEELDLHESTIARAVANKYINTPRGILALRGFFTSTINTQKGEALSSNTIRDALFEMLQNENKQAPLSDQAISNLLKAKGILCARRTIAKYRLELNIGNAQQRKKFN